MKKALTEIIKFNEERDWDQFHSPEDVYKRQGFKRLDMSRWLSLNAG